MPSDALSSLAQHMIALLALYGPIVVYVSVFFLGENAIVAAFALSAQGLIAPQTVFIFAALGSLSADVFWYTVAVKGMRRFSRKSFSDKPPEVDQAFLVRMADRHTFLFLICIKFLVGVRIFFTMYLVLKKHVAFRTYLFFNAIGTLLFVGVLFPIGWLLGKGVPVALSVEKGFFGIVSLVVVVLVLFHVIPRLITHLIARFSKTVSAGD